MQMLALWLFLVESPTLAGTSKCRNGATDNEQCDHWSGKVVAVSKCYPWSFHELAALMKRLCSACRSDPVEVVLTPALVQSTATAPSTWLDLFKERSACSGPNGFSRYFIMLLPPVPWPVPDLSHFWKTIEEVYARYERPRFRDRSWH